MKVNEVMSPISATCAPASTVSEATALLCNHSCCCLPVLNAEGGLLGMITDRCLLIALGTRNVRPSELLVGDVVTKDYPTCHTGDDAGDALRLMEERKVVCLPVIGEDSTIAGIVILNDLILRVRQRHFSTASANRRASSSKLVTHSLPVV